MGAPTGTPIRAALAGKVVKSYYSISYGNYTLIDHGNGMTTAYAGVGTSARGHPVAAKSGCPGEPVRTI
ncbi:MAG: M23 family metallopeptidase [Clostridiales bacterium]|nr:M23 family metallopeptidase [Clostridiales bacterium]